MMAPRFPLPDVSVLREDYRLGRLGVMGELGLPYVGVAPDDPLMEPYWALAEELNMPVGVHAALAPPNTPYQCCPKFRNSLGNPAVSL
jgi:predicted TIM-barrel fold metal-dependent hydrolase